MYCYTYVNEFACIFNELKLWSHISSEHPTFLKNVAKLTKVPLPKMTESMLDDLHKKFLELYNKVLYLQKQVVGNPNMNKQHVMAVKRAIDEFLFYDSQVLTFYPQLLNFSRENNAWQELVKHIIHEQTFMNELFKDLLEQIK